MPILIAVFLAITFMIPCNAINGKPSHALEQGDVSEWWRYDEGVVYNLDWTGYNLTMWWQIWINNETAATPWANATKAVCIMYITFPHDIDDDWWFAIKVWFQISDYINIDIGEFDHDIIWEEDNRSLALATEGEKLILMAGYNETSAPADPFTRWWAVKTPTNSSSVDPADLILMLEAISFEYVRFPWFDIFVILFPIELILIGGLTTVHFYKNRAKSKKISKQKVK